MHRSPPKILVVDDNLDLQRSIARELRRCRVRLASDMDAALEELQADPPDILLTDFSMPGANGVALLEIARRTRPDVRRVLMSADPPLGLGELIRAGVVQQFIAKPFTRPLRRELHLHDVDLERRSERPMVTGDERF